MSFIGELKRRNVFRVAAAYLLAAWVLLQAIDFVLDAISAPNWILQVFIMAAVAGFVIVLVFSWVFEMTPEGIKRERDIDRTQSITPQTGRKLDRVIIAFLAVAVVMLLADRFLTGSENHLPVMVEPGEMAESENGSLTPTLPSEKSIAVLPFLALSSGPDDEYFADGLTEEILNSLAQLPQLLVTSRTSAFHFKGKDIPVQEIATALGVGNIAEGSVRRSGDRLRVTAQLIRAEDGFHLWSENYDSTSSDTIAVQQDIAEKIATAMDVVMNESNREAMQKAGLRDVEAFIALQKGRELYEKAHGNPELFTMLRAANHQFEIVEQRVPGYSMAYQLHTDLYVHMLLNSATAQDLTGVSEQEINGAMDNVVQDYASAVEYAGTTDQRNNLEADAAIITAKWRGMPARIERFLGQQGCEDPNWVAFLTLPFGYADRMVSRASAFRACDPMYSTKWLNEARALLWAGDAAGAVEVALRGTEIAPGDWLTSALIRSRVALGQFELALQDVDTRLKSEGEVLLHRTLIAAAQGNKAGADEQSEKYRKNPAATDFMAVCVNAWTGSRVAANRVAAKIDAHPFGTMGLTTIINWCMCGAPWDLSATPNFAGVLKESGLPWPPVSPIQFPLKDW